MGSKQKKERVFYLVSVTLSRDWLELTLLRIPTFVAL